MPLAALIYFYGRRLRTHPVQEALAGLGIAVAVALVFAVQVANTSVTSASSQVVQGIVGSADMQVRARSSSGFDQRLADPMRTLPGVQAAAPVLNLTATALGPNGHELTIQLTSIGAALAATDGLAPHVLPGPLKSQAVMLPSAAARALGGTATPGP